MQVPIAIVGMAVRMPGGVRSTDDFWDLVLSKRDVSREVPHDRYNIDAFYSDARSRAVKVRRGYFLDDDLADIDASSQVRMDEAGYQDPQRRLLIEVAWECMENAGQTGWRGKDIGCYVGSFGEDWLEISLRDPLFTSRSYAFSASDFGLSNLLSYHYDLRGPSMTIRTACSASMSALHVACQSVASRECSSALVAGSSIVLTPTMTQCMSENLTLAPDGACKTFDRDADGFARGEAINALYIKRLDDAVRDGDPVRAVIRSTMNSCDGQTSPLAVPSAAAQESLIRNAYKRAGITDPTRTGLFECHGTGTSVGDLAETQAISRVFGDRGVYIGGVKPIFGHSEGASGITSIINGVLALEHRAIPPNAGIKHRNPQIPLTLRIAEELTPWPEDRDERISVNSFGIGGANSHVILESARSYLPRVHGQTTGNGLGAPKLVTVSATSPRSLERQIQNLMDYVKHRQVAPEDLAHTLGTRRDHYRHRAFAVTNGESWITDLSFESKLSPAVSPKVLVFVFTGQGAQWPGMAKQMMSTFDRFRADIQRLDRVLQALPHPPSWSMEDKICVVDDTSVFSQAEFAQPLCAAIQIALVNLLASWGVFPTCVVGHSSGEIAAAYAAKSITSEAAITIAYYRGQAAKCVSRLGDMIAVSLGPTAVRKYLTKGVQIACENSPKSTVLSGDEDALVQAIGRITSEEPDVRTVRLDVNTAYHSDHMVEIGELFQEMIRDQSPSCSPEIPFFSTVLGRALTESDRLDGMYWRCNLERPVLFSTTLQLMLSTLQDQPVCFVEVGPHCPLAGPIRQIFADTKVRPDTLRYVPTLHKNQNHAVNIIQAAGQMHLHGINISLAAVNGPGSVLTDLPPYPWDYSAKAWTEGRVSKGWRHRQYAHHELLGSRVLESNDIEPSWRNILRLEDTPWLCEHKFSGCLVYPGAAYVAAAGEAIRQISGHTRYAIKDLFIKSALFLDIDQDVELMTSLRPVKLTDILDSEWYQFTIYSCKDTEWCRHCTGLVIGMPDPVPVGEADQPLLRHVDADHWYHSLQDLGLDYGPSFRGLNELTADPTSLTAKGTITRNRNLDHRSYAVHPTVIDQGLQLIGVAAMRGIPSHMDQVAIPISIERLYCGFTGSCELRAVATCRSAGRGNFVGDSTAFGDEGVILDIRGVRAFGLESENHSGNSMDRLCPSSIDWGLNIECLPSLNSLLGAPAESSFQFLEHLCTLDMIEAYFSVEYITPSTPHLLKYKHWLAQRMEEFRYGRHRLVPETELWMTLEPGQRSTIYSSIVRRLEELSPEKRTKAMTLYEPCRRILGRLEDIFRGLVSPVEVYMADDGITAVYDATVVPEAYKPFFTALGRSRPFMRVLEIGAGTGAITAATLEGLVTERGTRMFSEYVFTDISPAFLSTGHDRFKNIPRMTFKTLDITRDPVEQGFDLASFDLVVCSNVLHATHSLRATLSNTRKLLRPDGYLFLQELCPESYLFSSFLGVLEGWWVGESDGRIHQPFISPGQWDEELKSAGFTGAEAVAFDLCQPWHYNANIISRAVHVDSTEEHVSLLIEGQLTETARSVENAFLQKGYKVTWCSLTSSPCENVVSLLDLDSPFFEGISQDSFDKFRSFMSKAVVKSMIWLTRSIQMECNDPNRGLVLGVARCIRMEFSLPFATVEVDSYNLAPLQALVRVHKNIQSALASHRVPDYEYCIQEGMVYTSRYYSKAQLPQAVRPKSPKVERRLNIGTAGLIDSLHWAEDETRFPGQGEVQIDVRYVALNFKDVMIAMGFVGNNDEIGCEATGIIRCVGPGPHPQDFHVGDLVFVLDWRLFRTSIVTESTRCYKVPAGMALADSVTMPVAYVTAMHSLVNLGRLERGQSVLIHSACGGVGLAAIQLSQMLGAEIFATVGTDVKVQHLVENYHIPRNRIFTSRNPSFRDGVLRETNGRGVDIVLNSLSGENLHASWECVAEFGKMIEIGKRDMLGRASLRMEPFLTNRSFFGVDLLHMGLGRPADISRTLKRLIGDFETGRLKPIAPITMFDAEDVQAAFRYMQSGQHIGKIVVRFPEEATRLPVSTELPFSLSSSGSYLLVGGLGGLGRAVARWMVERGARSLVFLSRSAGRSDVHHAFLKELSAMGCSAIAVAGDVSSPSDVQRALRESPCAVVGVIHMAMVLRDQMFKNMTHGEWLTTLAPKVSGTWNLYRALQNQPLDFFLVFGSIAGRIGNVGQTNYAAANCFLAAFAKYARARAFPAVVLDPGAVKDIGYVSEQPETFRLPKHLGLGDFVKERQLLSAVQAAIGLAQISATLAIDVDLTSLVVGLPTENTIHHQVFYENDIRFALHREPDKNHQKERSSQSNKISQLLAAVERDPSILELQSTVESLTVEIARLIRGEALEDDRLEAAAEIPIDSLMAIEIRNWLRKSINVDVPTMKIAKAKNIGGLSKLVIETIKLKLQPQLSAPTDSE
ncbi:fatty acid synthase S-acetyltransferase [Aspergillus californicus]